MANLNVPFLLLQQEQTKFKPLITASKITAGAKVKVMPPKPELTNFDEINFDQVVENLFVLADESTGNLALCSHEVYKSALSANPNFLVKFQPRVLLLPTIGAATPGYLQSHCFVRCPAPNILNASQMLLCTLHHDNILRLWNTDDGRCISQSNSDTLTSNGLKLKTIKGFPGHVLVIGDTADIYVVNVYTMTVVSHMCKNFKGCVKCKFFPESGTLQIFDENGALTELVDSRHRLNAESKIDEYTDDGQPKPLDFSQMLHLTKKQSALNFKFEQTFAIDGRSMLTVRRLKECQILAFHKFGDKSKIIAVAQDQIEQITFESKMDPSNLFNLNTKLPIKEFKHENRLIFAKFLPAQDPKFLVTVDITCTLAVWSVATLLQQYKPSEKDLMVMRVSFVSPEFEVSLFERCRVYDYHRAWLKEGFFNSLTSDFETKEQATDASMQFLRGLLIRSIEGLQSKVRGEKPPQLFKFFADENILYTTIQVGRSTFKKEKNLMLSWDFDSLFVVGQVNRGFTPLIAINNLQLFGSQADSSQSICPLSFNDLVMSSYFNRLQFDFFFTDELVTKQVTFFDKDMPSLIVGTNFGRICIVPMFQEAEDNVLPVTVIDNHGRNPIEQLYVVYQYTRASEREKGGHLISTSTDGTIAITELSTPSLMKMLQQHQQKERTFIGREKRRVDNVLQTRAQNQQQGRRNSVSTHFSTQNFFHYVRHQADMVFQQQTCSAVKLVCKVRTIQETVQFLKGVDKTTKPETAKPDVFYYACIAEESNEVVLLTFNKKVSQIRAEKLPLLAEPVNGVYLEAQNHTLMLVLKESLMMQQYNLRTRQLSFRKRPFSDVLKLLQIDETVESLFLSQRSFLTDLPAQDINNLDFHNFEKDDLLQRSITLSGNGLHPVLDFMNLGLNHPVQYFPQASLTAENSQVLRTFMPHKPDLIACRQQLTAAQLKQQENVKQEAQKQIVRAFDKAVHSDPQLNSDLNFRLYKQISGITPITAQNNNFLGSSQTILVANTQDVFDAFQRKLLRQQQDQGKEGPKDLSQNKWPTKVLSFLHPFNLDETLDENLERYFNLNLPFLDFRLGVQGANESFSFIISKEDQNYHSERDHITKIISLLRLSKQVREHMETYKKKQLQDVLNTYVDPNDATQFLGTFFNSENWKASPYLSTIIPTFFLSQLVSLIDFNEGKMQELGQEWLSVLQLIGTSAQFKHTVASPLAPTKQLSLTTISELLLKNDLNISSCVKDIICKPFLCNQTELSHQRLKETIDEWKPLLKDIYEMIKNDQKVDARQKEESKAKDQTVETSKRPIFSYFGQNETRGLITLSFYAFYCQGELTQLVNENRQMIQHVSKLVIFLIKEVVQRFKGTKYIHLLTTLLYLLQCNLKSTTESFNNRPIINDVVQQLLTIFNYYKPALSREQFITRVTAQNFHLIRPTNPELYLKFSGAKALLEIGVSFTDVFLELIQKHATTLNNGIEHQKNVLETLRYFINGYGDNLEQYLVQIVHILLQCLDPNELALRKNSHKYVSVILSTMVKIFPMVAFHHETQRLAVGTHEGPIGIYDVRTSAKWKVLEGHTSNVTCLAFDSNGNYLASYSAGDRTLKLWKVGNTGFFSTLISGTGKQSRQVALKPLSNEIKNPHLHLSEETKQNALDSRVGNLLPQDKDEAQQQQSQSQPKDSGQRINKCKITFIKPEEKIVELIREDDSRSVHDLVK